MKVRLSINLENYDALDEELRKLAALAEDRVMEEALEAGGETVVGGVGNRIDRDARRSTDTLKRSIKYRLDRSWMTERAYAVSFGWDKIAARRSKKGNVTYTTDYGPVLEFGEKRKLRHLKQGFEDTRDIAEEQMRNVIQGAINKTAE